MTACIRTQPVHAENGASFWHDTARAAGGSRTRKAAFPGRPLHVASPTGPGPGGREPRCTRCVVLPEAILREPKCRNARFAPNFRHHPGIGGHRSPCNVPTPVSTPPGALRDARRRAHFFAIFWRENFDVMPKKKKRVLLRTLPRRLPHKTKQRNEILRVIARRLPERKQRSRWRLQTELRSEYPRSHGGIEILRDGDAAVALHGGKR
jgi:hypothetical protein